MKINKRFIHSLINDIEFIFDEINHNDNNKIQVEDQLFRWDNTSITVSAAFIIKN